MLTLTNASWGGVMQRARIVAAAIVAVALVASGCSSTTKRGAATRAKDGGPAITGPGAEAASAAPGEASAAPGAAGSKSRAKAKAGAAGGTAGGGGAAGTLPTGGTLKVGVHLSANAAAASAFGVTLPQHSPAKVDAIVKWINENGGVGGRKLEVVYHTTDPLQGTFEQQVQETCTALAEDHKVTIAISGAQVYRDSLPACFAQHKIPFVWDVYFLTKRNVAPPEYLYRPAQPHADRMGVIIDGLARNGFFKNAKIGLVRYDTPKHRSVADEVFKPALAAHGLKIDEEFPIKDPDAASGAGESGAEASNAVLRFNTQGITHVLFIPSGGAIPLLFLAAAESQSYRPKYGLSSADAPYFLRDNLPKAQFTGAAGVGWAPPGDLGPAHPEGPTFSSAGKLCVEIAGKAGFAPAEAPSQYCDMLFFLRAALARPGTVNTDLLRRGTDELTKGYDSSVGLGTKFSPGRHDGAALARTFVWDGDWKYVGAPYPIP
jgi:ABC-type branched-subunit amino acid transport system substrate-binding protein